MARNSLIKNPSHLINAPDGAAVGDCVSRFMKATGLTEKEARENLIINGFFRYAALETYKHGKGSKKAKK